MENKDFNLRRNFMYSKKEIVREIKNVVSGLTAYSNIVVKKVGKGYELRRTFSRLPLGEAQGAMQFSHCCNHCTLKEAEDMLDELQ